MKSITQGSVQGITYVKDVGRRGKRHPSLMKEALSSLFSGAPHQNKTYCSISPGNVHACKPTSYHPAYRTGNCLKHVSITHTPTWPLEE